MWNLKYDTKESQTQKTAVVAMGEGLGDKWRGRLGLAGVSFHI